MGPARAGARFTILFSFQLSNGWIWAVQETFPSSSQDRKTLAADRYRERHSPRRGSFKTAEMETSVFSAFEVSEKSYISWPAAIVAGHALSTDRFHHFHFDTFVVLKVISPVSDSYDIVFGKTQASPFRTVKETTFPALSKAVNGIQHRQKTNFHLLFSQKTSRLSFFFIRVHKNSKKAVFYILGSWLLGIVLLSQNWL